MKKLFVVFLVVAFLTIGCGNVSEKGDSSDKVVENQEILVSAAASLTDAMESIASKYEGEKGVKVNLNLASSGTLQKQIENGAPADIFISASKAKMDGLLDGEYIIKETNENLLENSIVVIMNKDYSDKFASFEDILSSDEKISIGAPDSVPAGKYAKEALENMGVFEDIQDRLVFGKNVKQVAKYIETGEIVAGIVYLSDTIVLENVDILQEIDSSMHSKIVYPLGIIKERQNDVTNDFVDYLKSDECIKIFEEYGFKKAE